MNKVLTCLYVPEIDKTYEIFLPLSKRIGEIIELLNASINELSSDELKKSDTNTLYNRDTGRRYDKNEVLANTDITNNTNLILLS